MSDGLDPTGKGWLMGEWEIKEDKKKNTKTHGYKGGKADKFHGSWGGLLMHFLQEKVVPKEPPASKE